jgi:putative ABC transport system permease protein
MGESIVIAWPGASTISYKGFTKGRSIRVTPEDLEMVREKVPEIGRISPEFRQNRRVRYKKEEFNNTLRGVNVEYQFMRSIIPQKGRFLNDLDIQRNRRVCFLGDVIAENLFHDEEPVGKEVMVEGVPFTVIGVMIEKIQTSNYSGQRDEHCLFIPHTTYKSLYGQKFVQNILAQPRVPEQSAAVVNGMRQHLGEKCGFSPEDNDALFIWDFTELERSLGVFFLAFNIFLGMIGSFTLLVGGVGVASIMLVVVEERIKEIGVKLAVGAKRRQILIQFFSEALTIILIGGLMGFGFAAFVLGVVPVELIQDYVGIPKINYTVGVVTILVLLGIGTIAGMMPARRAASTDPIEALRS